MFSIWLLYFIVYSFLGWIYESLYYSVQLKKPVNAGFLKGCICPIYGIACVGNIFLLSDIKNDLVVFAASMTVITSIEYIVSFFLEKFFGKRWWDYSKWPMNINGRVSLLTSLAFGAMSLFQLRLIHPSLSLLLSELSAESVQTLLVFCVAASLADVALSIKSIDKNSEDDDKLWFVNEELPVMRANEKISSKAKEVSERYSERYDDVKKQIKTKIHK